MSVVVIIIGFRRSADILACLGHLEEMREPDFAVHVCENGGDGSYRELVGALQPMLSLDAAKGNAAKPASIAESAYFLTRGTGRGVVLHRAVRNLGYAGGINAVLASIEQDPAWDAVWILNPDTEPYPDALLALRQRAEAGGYGIVGSRIVLKESGRIQMYGGRWRTWMARGLNLGRGAPASATPDIEAIERETDYVCGASMYVTREFVRAVGKMEEGYFLYVEEVDWCFRRGRLKLGYAHDSVILHEQGTTIGSASRRRERAPLSVYLDERNKLLFTRKFFPKRYPLVVLSTLMLTTQYVAVGAFGNFRFALAGWLAGIRGELGQPKRFAPAIVQEHDETLPSIKRPPARA